MTSFIKNSKKLFSSVSGILSAASSTISGYLTSTDWNIFNNKQDALVSGTNIKTVNGSTLLGSGDLTVSGSAGLTDTYVGYGDGSNVLTGTSDFTFDSTNHRLKLNPSVVSTEARSSIPLQIGGDIITIGSNGSANVTPTFIEMLKSNGSGNFYNMRGGFGYLGSFEMNTFLNMNYTGGTHKYYDTTQPAIWSFMGSTGTYGYQYVPANNPNTGDIYNTYGCVPFRADIYNQPATGKGISGFSTLKFAQLSFTDITNTSSVTNTPAILQLDGGILKLTSATGTDTRLTQFQGAVTYNSGTATGTDLKLMTAFGVTNGTSAANLISYTATVGAHVGAQGMAEDGNINVGLIGKAVKAKASTTNIGIIGVGSNTNATAPIQIGGYFGLTGITGTLPASLTSAALIADNGSSTSDIFQCRDNQSVVFQVIDGGKVVLGNTLRLKNYTVATLPVGTQGDEAFVTDALTPTYLGIAVGGGSVVCKVFYNGTNWIT